MHPPAKAPARSHACVCVHVCVCVCARAHTHARQKAPPRPLPSSTGHSHRPLSIPIETPDLTQFLSRTKPLQSEQAGSSTLPIPQNHKVSPAPQAHGKTDSAKVYPGDGGGARRSYRYLPVRDWPIVTIRYTCQLSLLLLLQCPAPSFLFPWPHHVSGRTRRNRR
jgi:hypothetical protein